MLALIETRYKPDRKVDLSVARVLTVAIPLDSSEWQPRYFIAGEGWTDTQPDREFAEHVLEIAAPSDMERIVRHHIADRKIANICDCSGLEPWVDVWDMWPPDTEGAS